MDVAKAMLDKTAGTQIWLRTKASNRFNNHCTLYCHTLVREWGNQLYLMMPLMKEWELQFYYILTLQYTYFKSILGDKMGNSHRHFVSYWSKMIISWKGPCAIWVSSWISCFSMETIFIGKNNWQTVAIQTWVFWQIFSQSDWNEPVTSRKIIDNMCGQWSN